MPSLVPQSGRLGLGVSILSYAGSVTLGVVSDAVLIPDTEKISGWLADELAELRAALTLGPAPGAAGHGGTGT